jgi:hypothetical protein
MVRLARLSALAFAASTIVAAAACTDDDASTGRLPARLPDRHDADPPAEDAGDDEASSGPSCTNGVRDGDETDVDCGGGACPPCANGRACAVRRDCAALVCAGGRCSADLGCADGTREAFASLAEFPDIAACAGGWSVPGLLAVASPACGREAGNASPNPTGSGCNVADLCQVGWHVCATAAEVAARTAGAGCAGAAAGQDAFYAVRQSGPGGAECGVGANDLFGCGDQGASPDMASCAPLDRFSGDLCAELPLTWQCGQDGGDEANAVTKIASEGGGVLCCRD